MLSEGIQIRQENQDNHKLTACHIRASNAVEREGCLLEIITHTDSSAITLVNSIDEEISESGMSASKLSSSSCEDDNLDECEEHVVDF